MTESSTYSPALSYMRVDVQAVKVALSIRSIKKVDNDISFFQSGYSSL